MKDRSVWYRIFYIVILIVPLDALAQWNIQSVSQVTPTVRQYEKNVFTITITGSFTNPYDENDISLDAVLTSPSSKTLRFPCFYVSGDGTSSQWQARITLREAGTYSGQFELKKNGVLKSTFALTDLNSEATAKDGFIKKKDNWSFQFDSGKPFRGIGENVAWEGRSWEPDNYTYDYFLTKLANNGMNYFRTWSSAWNLPLEWKTVVDTKRYTNSTSYYHPQGAERLDELVDLCESKNLFMMLTLGWHGELQTGDRWNINVYNTANGGPASTPTEFFTAAQAKKQYQNRLRYIIARWGYSPSIASIEFFNEIDNAIYNGTESTIAIPHNVVTQWHDDMSTYMKNNDPYNHLLTTSVSHREITGLFNVTNLDFVQKHVYKATGTIPSVITDLESRYSKPFVTGEFGYDWDWNNITAANGPNLDFDFKRGLWYGLFSPTPVSPMSWWWEFFDQRGTSDYFKSIKEISDKMLAVGKGNYSSVSATTPSLSIEAYSVKCGNTYFAYVLNNNSSASNNKIISLAGVTNGTYEIQSYNPEDRTYTSLPNVVVVSGNSLLLTISLSARTSTIFIIKPAGDTQGLQSSFKVSPISLPGTIEAEDFDLGGEGIAYHDLEAANLGGQYRNTEGVDIETCSAGGFDVTNTITGEWLEYSVNIETSGTYTIKSYVATTGTDKKFKLTLDGEQIAEPTVNATGGNQNWSVVETTTSLVNKGNHILRILFEDGSINIDKLEFEVVDQAPEISLVNPIDGAQFETPSTIALQVNTSDADGSIAKVEYFSNGVKVGESTQSPFNIDWNPTQGTYSVYGVATDDKGLSVQSASVTIVVKPSQVQQPFPDASSPHVIPGKIEAEDVDSGLEGVAYHDLTPTNIKGAYRTDVDFDIEASSDTNGGFDLADIQATEWVEYSTVVGKTAKYDFTFRVATQMSAQSFSVLINDKVVVASVAVPNTGNWQTWKDVTAKGVSMNEGSAVLKLLFNSEFFNLNYILISESEIVTSVDHDNASETVIYPNPSHAELNLILPSTAQEVKIVNTQGLEVYKNQTLTERKLTITNSYPAGMYIVIVQHRNGSIEYLKALIRP